MVQHSVDLFPQQGVDSGRNVTGLVPGGTVRVNGIIVHSPKLISGSEKTSARSLRARRVGLWWEETAQGHGGQTHVVEM